jgi:hypothetical protein
MDQKISVDPILPRRETTGTVVAVLRTSRDDRGLKLIRERTRCIRRFDIHELIITDENNPKPGGVVDHIGYLAFVEFEVGGVIAIGDLISIDGKPIGRLAGFDETHAPNHMNIVLQSQDRTTGLARGLKLGPVLSIKPSPV